MPYTIGVAGYAGAGKDTVVDRLVDAHGFGRVAFADPLRAFARAVNPIIAWDEDAGSGAIRYNDALAAVGYRKAKDIYPEFREILQRIGTEGCRETFWDSFWVDLAIKRASELDRNVAFSDLRFPNEAEACDFTVWVSRVGVGPVNSHVSDNVLSDYDFDLVLVNDSTFDDLYEQVDDMVAKFTVARADA